MTDNLTSSEIRIEIAPGGAPFQVSHRTRAEFDAGLADVVRIDGAPAAVVGSSGPNTAEHRQPKLGRALVPLPTVCRVETGADLILVDGRPIAHEDSLCRVPDAFRPVKSGVLEVEQDLVLVEGRRVLRGSA